MTPDLPVLTIDDAAMIVLSLSTVMQRMEEAGIDDRPPSQPLPRGVLSCGEACMITGAAMVLLVGRFPQIQDPDVFQAALQGAVLSSFTGKVN